MVAFAQVRFTWNIAAWPESMRLSVSSPFARSACDAVSLVVGLKQLGGRMTQPRSGARTGTLREQKNDPRPRNRLAWRRLDSAL